MNQRNHLYTVILSFCLFLFIINTIAVPIYAAEPTTYKENSKYERLIAHGGGSVRGYGTTNSVEAVMQAIDHGFRLIELDMGITKDQEVVMLHDWEYTSKDMLGLSVNNKLTLEQFQKAKILDQFEPMTFDKLSTILKEHPEVRIITDTKENNIKLLTLIAQKYPNCKNQIIPQIYSCDEVKSVKALGYKQIILTLYKMQSLNAPKIIRFVKDNGIYAVTMSEELRNHAIVKQLQSYGIVVYMHTINDMEQLQDAKKKGAFGIYTDDLVPADWQSLQSESYYLTKTSTSNTGKRLDYEFYENGISVKLMGSQSSAGDKVQCSSEDKILGEGSVGTLLHLDTQQLSPGKHTLNIVVTGHSLKQKDKLTYYMWVDKGLCQVVNETNKYLLDDWVIVKDFEAVMKKEDKLVRDILRKSIISKAGSSLHYNEGKPDFYRNGKQLQRTCADEHGNTMLHLATIGKKLGATSVFMDETKTMRITDKGKLYTNKIGSASLNKGEHPKTLNQKTALVQGRAFATGEFYQEIFERDYLDEDGILILLPESIKLEKKETLQLVSAAKKLFQ